MSVALLMHMIPPTLRRPLGQSRRYAAYPGLAGAQIWPMGEAVAMLVPPKRPAILLVSMPRGGSSWMGRILGASEESLYLHEPVTSSYLRLIGGRGASEFEYGACRHRRGYDRLSSLAFRGIPRFHESVVLFPGQWSSIDRRNRRVVIKEVNPLVLDVLIERFQPRVIYLLRHPVAVARSYHALGWGGAGQFRSRFTGESLAELERRFTIPYDGTFWEQSGALQAIVQHRAMDALSAAPDHAIVRYEDLCADPVGEFSRLFAFCELPFSAETRAEIERSSRSDRDYRPGGSDTARDSRAMIGRWREDVGAENIAMVRESYLANRPLFYGDPGDW